MRRYSGSRNDSYDPGSLEPSCRMHKGYATTKKRPEIAVIFSTATQGLLANGPIRVNLFKSTFSGNEWIQGQTMLFQSPTRRKPVCEETRWLFYGSFFPKEHSFQAEVFP